MYILWEEIRGWNTMLLGHTGRQRANKYLKIFQLLYPLEDYNLKLPWDYVTSVKMVISSGQITTNVDENVYTYISVMGVGIGIGTVEIYGAFSEKLKKMTTWLSYSTLELESLQVSVWQRYWNIQAYYCTIHNNQEEE